MPSGSAQFPTAEPFLPRASPSGRVRLTLKSLRESAAVCEGCDLHERATQTVFGEGRVGALVMFIGEQPGDQEDLVGKPFVGPAGRMLDKALEEVGIPRKDVYVTNAVKHFKWEPRGKRRIHGKPTARQVAACKPWLKAEVEVVKPPMIVCLGATAAQAVMGKDFRLTRDRGRVFDTSWAHWTMATVHPSSLLRVPDSAAREQAFADFVADLRTVADVVAREKG